MEARRYATSRRKACQNCSTAKARCDLKAGRCSRCALRCLPCVYPRATTLSEGSTHNTNNREGSIHGSLVTSNVLPASEALLSNTGRELPSGTDTWSSIVGSIQSTGDNSLTGPSLTSFTEGYHVKDSRPNAMSRAPEGLETLDFTVLELCCPINVDDISNRWLNSYVPLPGQKTKDYPANVTAFIYRILKSYATATARGRGVPPFVHPSQIMATSTRLPLSNCLSLVRICERPLPGSESVAADVLQREMSCLYDQHQTYDDMALLAAFQAYLIYCMVLFFRLSRGPNPFLRQAMTNLQDLACSSSRRGLMCIAERRNARPNWESWIVAEAKRRTLFAMYLFDSMLLSQDGLPTFLGTELQGLPAPASKFLWRAQTRNEWEREYNTHLADWAEGGLYIDELWPIPTGLDERGLLERRNRVDQWLEDIDEFGTMLYAVTSCTHGG